MAINSIQELRDRAWLVRRYKNELRTAEALILDPSDQKEVEQYIANLDPLSEEQLEALTKLGYALREENRQPGYAIEIEEMLYPLWYSDRLFHSISIALVKSHRVVKGRIDDQDHLFTGYLKNRAKRKKKEGLPCEDILEELEQSKQRTFRDRFNSWADEVDDWDELGPVIEKSKWFLLTNVLKSPKYMTISCTQAKADGEREYSKERVREGISIYFSHQNAGRKGSYVEASARSAVTKNHCVGEWFFFAEEPKPSG